jgi:hypothetical protein
MPCRTGAQPALALTRRHRVLVRIAPALARLTQKLQLLHVKPSWFRNCTAHQCLSSSNPYDDLELHLGEHDEQQQSKPQSKPPIAAPVSVDCANDMAVMDGGESETSNR